MHANAHKNGWGQLQVLGTFDGIDTPHSSMLSQRETYDTQSMIVGSLVKKKNYTGIVECETFLGINTG